MRFSSAPFVTNFAIAASLALGLFAAHPVSAAAAPADDKAKVLERLNASAASFRSTQADAEFDTIETDPVYDKDVQTGEVYYQRTGGTVKMGAHFQKHNGRPSAKAYVYSDGTFKLFEPTDDTVTTISKADKYQSYIILGFGASGTDLEAKWNITYLGSENLSDGKAQVKTEKLELVAKDPDLRKNLQKVTIWVDTDRAVSLKQVFIMSSTNTYQCIYSNFKMNQSIPPDAFKFKTDSKTTYTTR